MLSNYFIRGFLEGAKRQGRDIASIFKEAGINPTIADNPEAFIDGKQLQCLFIALMNEMN